MGKAGDKIVRPRAKAKRLTMLEQAQKLRETHPDWQPQPFSPEQAQRFRDEMKQMRENAAMHREFARIIDRHLAIRDGLIPPPWMQATTVKRKTKGAILPTILRELWPPTGHPPADLLGKNVTDAVNDVLKSRQMPEVSRHTVSREIKKLPRR